MASFMIVGTNSCCGKSFTSSALIRFLRSKGYSVAPFKAQNISSQAVEIGNGKEIAVSTFIQSSMAEIEPDSVMNPVLIKPDKGNMKIYLNGIFYASDNYREYSRYIPAIKDTVLTCFHRLKGQYDFIIIEGAGSPAEINCLEEDISNSFMASMADSAIVVGDISLGGFFAAMHGTLELMPQNLRSKVCAFIVNKYLGEKNKLLCGISAIERWHDIKCIGIIPYMSQPRDLAELKDLLDAVVSTEYDFEFLFATH